MPQTGILQKMPDDTFLYMCPYLCADLSAKRTFSIITVKQQNTFSEIKIAPHVLFFNKSPPFKYPKPSGMWKSSLKACL